MTKRVSAVVDEAIVEFFQNHREYNLSGIVRDCLRNFVRAHEEVKVRVVSVDGKPPEKAFKVGDEFYLIRKEWEELEEDAHGKYMVARDPATEEIAILYLEEVGEEHGD